MRSKKKNLFAAFIVLCITAVFLTSCDWFEEEEKKGPDDQTVEECEHNWTLSIEDSVSPTCAEDGYDAYTCALCGETKQEVKPKTGNHIFLDNVCVNCGTKAEPVQQYTSGKLIIYVYNADTVYGATEKRYSLIFDGTGNVPSVLWSAYSGKIRAITIRGREIGLPDNAFSRETNLEKITISGTLSAIGKRCFYGCSELATLTLPDGILTVGDEAFASCTALNSVEIGKTLREIGENAFADCDKIRTLSVPFVGTKSRVGKNALFGSLFSVGNKENHSQALNDFYYTVPSSLTYVTVTGDGEIPAYAFSGFSDNLRSLTLSKDITKIGEYAFFEGTGYRSIAFEDGTAIDSIGKYAFYGCRALTSFVLPDAVTTICEKMFYGCDGLTSFEFGENSSLVSIETQAFEGCSSLTRLVFPEKTESVGLSAFSNCSGVVDITLPAGIKTIAKKAFSGCTKIQNLYIRSQYVADFLSNDSNLFDRGVNLLVYIAPGLNVNQISYLAKNDFRKLSNIPAEKDGVQYYLWQK